MSRPVSLDRSLIALTTSSGHAGVDSRNSLKFMRGLTSRSYSSADIATAARLPWTATI
jgi:hypothetical protein